MYAYNHAEQDSEIVLATLKHESGKCVSKSLKNPHVIAFECLVVLKYSIMAENPVKCGVNVESQSQCFGWCRVTAWRSRAEIARTDFEVVEDLSSSFPVPASHIGCYHNNEQQPSFSRSQDFSSSNAASINFVVYQRAIFYSNLAW